MFDPLSDNTRVVNVPGTDTILQLLRKKNKTYILALSKEELRGSPDSWKSSVISGTLIYSTLFIWASVLAPVAFPLLLLGSPVFILATVISMKGLNNFLLSDPVQEEASPEDDRDFGSTSNLPEISISFEKDLLRSSDKEIIEAYREKVFNSGKKIASDFIDDRTFSELFKSETDDSKRETIVEDPVFEEETVLVENENNTFTNRQSGF